MAKWYGIVGFVETSETSPGVWEEVITEGHYYGDLNRVGRNWQNTEHKNDDVSINNELSILADPFAMNNFYSIRYVNWMGTNIKVQSVTVDIPRIVLALGGVYNGRTGPSSSST